MSFPEEDLRTQYTTNGVTTVFDIDFTILNQEDIGLYYLADADVSESLLVLTTDYTVNTALTQVTTTSALAAGKLTITRKNRQLQNYAWPAGGPFTAASLNNGLDFQGMQNLQAQERIARVILQQINDDLTADLTLPLKANRAEKLLGFNSDGDVVTLVSTGDCTNPIVNTEAYLDSTNPTAAAGQYVFASDTGQFAIGDGSTAWLDLVKIQLNSTSDYFAVLINNTEIMRIDSGGNVGVGETNPTNTLQISGAFGSQFLISRDNAPTTQQFRVDVGGNVADYYAISTLAAAGSTRHRFYTQDSVATNLIMTIRDGGVGIGTETPSYHLELSTDSAGKPTTNTWTISSDKRLKENIQPADLDLCYDNFKALPLMYYRWKDDIYSDKEAPDRNMVGYIADDVEKVFPKAVHKYVHTTKKQIGTKVEKQTEIDKKTGREKEVDVTVPVFETINDCKNLNSDQIEKAHKGATLKLIEMVEAQRAVIEDLTKRVEKLEKK